MCSLTIISPFKKKKLLKLIIWWCTLFASHGPYWAAQTLGLGLCNRTQAIEAPNLRRTSPQLLGNCSVARVSEYRFAEDFMVVGQPISIDADQFVHAFARIRWLVRWRKTCSPSLCTVGSS
jgi:hypothetical protein